MNSVKAIVFDAGNTLAHLDYAFIARVLAEHGCSTTPMAIRIAEYGAKAAIDRELAPEMAAPESVEGLLWPQQSSERPSYFAMALHHLGIPRERMQPMLEALRRHNDERCLWRVIEPDTRAVLGALRQRGFTLAVVSNSDGRIEGDLRRAGLGDYFATIVDSHVVGVEKPNPAIFHLALDRIGVASDEAVYVGDVFGIDVLGARKAGMQAILMDPLGRYPGKVDCPRITRLGELLHVIGA